MATDKDEHLALLFAYFRATADEVARETNVAAWAKCARQPYGLVRVTQLLQGMSVYDGWGWNRRSPEVGDIGALIDICKAPCGTYGLIAEKSDADGCPIWLCIFVAEELEPYPGPEPDKT